MIRAIIVLDIRIKSLVADGSSGVLNLIFGVDEIASGKTGILGEIFGIVGSLTFRYGKLGIMGAKLSRI